MKLLSMLILIMLETLIKEYFLLKYIFTIGGCAISQKAIRQFTVAFSGTKAEYIAIMKVYKEAI